MRPKEFEIPVSWGHIAGLTWGKMSGFPILCTHGLLDNAGTFSRLIPLLPKRFYWVSIDLPGHGKSSHFEGGHPIEFTHLLYSLKAVVSHFKWEKIYLMAHSFGALVSTFFTSAYPNLVVKAILIDGLVPNFIPDHKYNKALTHKFHQYDAQEAALLQKTPPSYSYKNAMERLIKNRPSFITPEAAKALMRRSLAVSGDGFRYSTDQRFKLLPIPLISLAQTLNIIESIKCPCLLLIAQNSLTKLEQGTLKLLIYTKESLSALDNIPNFTYKVIPGDHDVHLNDPDSVAKAIIPFLQDTQSTL